MLEINRDKIISINYAIKLFNHANKDKTTVFNVNVNHISGINDIKPCPVTKKKYFVLA